MKLEKTQIAEEDIQKLSSEVRSTFESKLEAMEKNLKIGATPDQVFHKRMAGNMHPILQINLGRDYRAWFLEGGRIDLDWTENNTIYCVMVLTKKESKKLSNKIKDPLKFIENRLQN